jgi:hypothetical protein
LISARRTGRHAGNTAVTRDAESEGGKQVNGKIPRSRRRLSWSNCDTIMLSNLILCIFRAVALYTKVYFQIIAQLVLISYTFRLQNAAIFREPDNYTLHLYLSMRGHICVFVYLTSLCQ